MPKNAENCGNIAVKILKKHKKTSQRCQILGYFKKKSYLCSAKLEKTRLIRTQI